MTTTARTTAVGVFTDRQAADAAIDALQRAGFKEDQLGYVTRHDVGDRDLSSSNQFSSVQGAAAGAFSGGVLGGMLGAAVSLIISGLGPAIAAGALTTSVVGGAALGAVTGGFIGSLVASGIPEEEAQYYQDQIIAGHTIVTVTTLDAYQEALDILRQCGAIDTEARDDLPALNDGSSKLGYTPGVVPAFIPDTAFPTTQQVVEQEEDNRTNDNTDVTQQYKSQYSPYATDPLPNHADSASTKDIPLESTNQQREVLIARKVQSQRSIYDTDPGGDYQQVNAQIQSERRESPYNTDPELPLYERETQRYEQKQEQQ